jgi:hypothetical protein
VDRHAALGGSAFLGAGDQDRGGVPVDHIPAQSVAFDRTGAQAAVVGDHADAAQVLGRGGQDRGELGRGGRHDDLQVLLRDAVVAHRVKCDHGRPPAHGKVEDGLNVDELAADRGVGDARGAALADVSINIVI